MLTCCEKFRRQTPHNYIALMVFTVAESFLVGVVSSIYSYKIVILAVLITAAICISLTIFAFQTKIDFTVYNGLLFVLLMVLMLFGIIAMFWRDSIVQLIYASLGALLFSAVSVSKYFFSFITTMQQCISRVPNPLPSLTLVFPFHYFRFNFVCFNFCFLLPRFFAPQYLIVDTQMIVGGTHKNQISSEGKQSLQFDRPRTTIIVCPIFTHALASSWFIFHFRQFKFRIRVCQVTFSRVHTFTLIN